MKEIFKQIIREFFYRESTLVKIRHLEIPLDSQKIISIIGPRRAGKSFFLFQNINKLLGLGISRENIIYINFEDERINIKAQDLGSILDAYFELYPEKENKDIYIFLDEIQVIDGWEKFVRRINENGFRNIFITGSNSKLLSKEIATSLRGRTLSYEIFPLSFEEFLEFKGEKLDKYFYKQKAKLMNLAQEYLKWGGFPEIINYDDSIKLKILQEYFNVMIYNDIIERYSIKDTALLKDFIKRLMQCHTKEFSINKIGGDIRSSGYQFDKNILYNFLEYLENIYLMKILYKYDYSLKKQLQTKKIYCIDNGFLSSIIWNFSENYGKLFENLIFLILYRKYNDKVFFLQNGVDIDFIVSDQENTLYQVCYELNAANQERELLTLEKGVNKYGKKGFLITFQDSSKYRKNVKNIEYLNFIDLMVEISILLGQKRLDFL